VSYHSGNRNGWLNTSGVRPSWANCFQFPMSHNMLLARFFLILPYYPFFSFQSGFFQEVLYAFLFPRFNWRLKVTVQHNLPEFITPIPPADLHSSCRSSLYNTWNWPLHVPRAQTRSGPFYLHTFIFTFFSPSTCTYETTFHNKVVFAQTLRY
jgi:hypothetical protein